MSDIQWTSSQKQAIEASNCDLLVSASAGSGKTAVLVQRILDHVTDDRYNGNILEMLVVTYTNAAAAQLKEKLSKAIKTAIAKNPRNKRLKRQLRDLPRASISTINSFCLDLLKKHFAELGLSANLRIADQSENTLLMTEIMEQTIERFYERGNELGIDDFASFCNNFAQLRDTGIAATFMSLYETLYTQLEGLELLCDKGGTSDSEPFNNVWGKEIRDKTVKYINTAKRSYEQALKLIEATDGLETAYGPAFHDDLEIMENILSNCEKGYFSVQEYLRGIKHVRLKSTVKLECKAEIEQAKIIRSFFKTTTLQKNIMPLYKNDFKTAEYLGEKTAKLNRQLYCFLKYFHNSFMEEKNRRGIVSFGDCEYLALKLLCKDNKPTETAKEYRRRFKEIYIDEYQDVNSVQDTIFKMISAPDTRFMVGDIKQSIYAFRGGEPRLFDEYRNSFVDYTDSVTAQNRGCRLFLSNNFRSSENIIRFANKVSSNCFINGESKVEYMSGDDLVFSKITAEADDDQPVTIALVEQNEEKNSEAAYVCDRVEELLQKGVQPKDITLLFRSIKTKALTFINELDKRGIPYYCDVKKEFFDNPEIMLLLCWLNAIDNPRRDVFVCGIAKSPIYNFTLDDLITVKRCCNRDTLYNSIKDYSELYDFEKGKKFISEIEELRGKARGCSAHSVIWNLIYDRGLMNVVMSNKSAAEAQVAHDNLLLFYDYARNYETGEFKGIYSFLMYIEKVIEAKQALPSATAFAGSGNTVKIMTIHHSKGLEFPYCFICDCDKKTNTDFLKKRLLFHRDFGIAAKISDKSGFVLYDSYIMNALKSRITDENIDEEYRVLYVALTRCVNRLWICATVDNAEKTFEKYTGVDEMMSMLYATANNNYLAWILSSLSGMSKDIYRVEFAQAYSDATEITKTTETGIDIVKALDTQRLKKDISYEYPYKKTAVIPAKMSVSRLYPDILDNIDGIELSTVIKPKIPFFAQRQSTNRGTEVGNMTHAFMQFCCFENVDLKGVSAELDRLCQKQFLPSEAAELVNVAAVERFFNSELYNAIKASDEIYREKRFNVNLPASDFTKERAEEYRDETVLVQGVIDCFFYTKDGIVLVDYKTDNVDSEAELIQRHSRQLEYYKKALETMTGDRVVKSCIYSFSLGKEIVL